MYNMFRSEGSHGGSFVPFSFEERIIIVYTVSLFRAQCLYSGLVRCGRDYISATE